jgi:hypothetical protein
MYPLNNTCKNIFDWQLLNTKSFIVSQVAQHTAAGPVNKKYFISILPLGPSTK